MGWEPFTRVEVNSSGLTTSTTSYSIGDQVGAQFTLATVAGANNGFGVITGIEVVDYAKVLASFNLWLFRDSVTPASDNAAFSLSDADTDKIIDGMPRGMPAPVSHANTAAIGEGNLWLEFQSGSGHDDLFALIETRGGHTFFGATTDLRLKVSGLKWVP